MTHDPIRANSVLFGGQGTNNGFLRDTWTYADGVWKQWRSGWWGARPSARCGHSLTFDETTGFVVLFGGIGSPDRALGDTWLFDGNGWRPVAGKGPAARRYAAFAYDPERKGCVLHGGAEDDNGRRTYGDSWLFRDNIWTPLGVEFDTDLRDDHGMGYHRMAKKLVLLEGVGGKRGILELGARGWLPASATALHPRHQCSPLVWDDRVGGLILHGGEVNHGGSQFAETLVLRAVSM